jgi:hypothetical protein
MQKCDQMKIIQRMLLDVLTAILIIIHIQKIQTKDQPTLLVLHWKLNQIIVASYVVQRNLMLGLPKARENIVVFGIVR